jgi:hypothetical protein
MHGEDVVGWKMPKMAQFMVVVGAICGHVRYIINSLGCRHESFIAHVWAEANHHPTRSGCKRSMYVEVVACGGSSCVCHGDRGCEGRLVRMIVGVHGPHRRAVCATMLGVMAAERPPCSTWVVRPPLACQADWGRACLAPGEKSLSLGPRFVSAGTIEWLANGVQSPSPQRRIVGACRQAR